MISIWMAIDAIIPLESTFSEVSNAGQKTIVDWIRHHSMDVDEFNDEILNINGKNM